MPSPAGPDTEPDAALQTYPVRLFAPFTRLHAAELGRPFAESFRVRIVPNEPAREVSSCTALLELALTHEPDLEPGTELDIQAFWSTAVECLALRMVAGARPAQRSRLEQVVWVEDPSGLLPPLLGMIDFFDERKRVGAAAARCRSWRAYDKSLRMTKQNADVFMIATDAWSGELSLYARGDFDADGYEDLLVRRDGSAEGGGSFEASALFMLSQTDADRCIRVARELGRS